MKNSFIYISISYLSKNYLFLSFLCLVVFSNSIQANNSSETSDNRDTNVIQQVDDINLEVCNYSKSIIIDLGSTIIKGSTYEVVWKKSLSNDAGSITSCVIRESETQTNFIKNNVVGRTTSFLKQRLTLTASCDMRYVLLKPASPMDDKVEIDAIKKITTSVYSTKEDSLIMVTAVEDEVSSNSHNGSDFKLFSSGFHCIRSKFLCVATHKESIRQNVFKNNLHWSLSSEYTIQLSKRNPQNSYSNSLMFWLEIRPPPI